MSIEIAEKIDKYVVRDGMDIYKERYENMTREKLQRKKCQKVQKRTMNYIGLYHLKRKKSFFKL